MGWKIDGMIPEDGDPDEQIYEQIKVDGNGVSDVITLKQEENIIAMTAFQADTLLRILLKCPGLCGNEFEPNDTVYNTTEGAHRFEMKQIINGESVSLWVDVEQIKSIYNRLIENGLLKP